MEIGYSIETLWSAIRRQMADIKSESEWLEHYTAKEEVLDVEDCAKNIIDSCKAILENIEHLKGEKM